MGLRPSKRGQIAFFRFPWSGRRKKIEESADKLLRAAHHADFRLVRSLGRRPLLSLTADLIAGFERHPKQYAVIGAGDGLATPRGRVLIAEDNLVNQRVAKLQVERLGFAADVVGNGEEALAALNRLDYALVLMDCQMPGMDGYAATHELRLREDGARRTPVVAMTANAFAADHEACLGAGMDDYLTKPVGVRALQQVLDRWANARWADAGVPA